MFAKVERLREDETCRKIQLGIASKGLACTSCCNSLCCGDLIRLNTMNYYNKKHVWATDDYCTKPRTILSQGDAVESGGCRQDGCLRGRRLRVAQKHPSVILLKHDRHRGADRGSEERRRREGGYCMSRKLQQLLLSTTTHSLCECVTSVSHPGRGRSNEVDSTRAHVFPYFPSVILTLEPRTAWGQWSS